MNWLTNIIRPRIRSLVEQKDVPDNLWQKCQSCDGMLFHRDFKESMNVCYHCGHHHRITVKERLAIMFDDGKYQTLPVPDVPADPLRFKDRKRYTDRMRDTRHKTGLKDAITIAKGTIGGQPVVIAAFNFSFMGGSMGLAVGEGLVVAAEEAVKTKSAFITIPSSGGARMQEGMLSLMQMPRSIIGVEMVKDAGLPYLVLLTDPTTGGVSASFAMVGDIHMAEPGATIGFAGRRVIEETVRETLPDDFQTAEYLEEHGMVDLVVPRSELAETTGRLLNLLMKKEETAPSGAGKTTKKSVANKKQKNKTSTKNKASDGPAAKASKQIRQVQKSAQRAGTLKKTMQKKQNPKRSAKG